MKATVDESPLADMRAAHPAVARRYHAGDSSTMNRLGGSGGNPALYPTNVFCAPWTNTHLGVRRVNVRGTNSLDAQDMMCDAVSMGSAFFPQWI
jgi:hypothetical protein